MKTIYPHGIFKAIPITVFVLFLAISALATTYTVSTPIDGTALVGNAADTLYVDAKITVTSVGGSDVIWNFTTVIVRPPGGEIRWDHRNGGGTGTFAGWAISAAHAIDLSGNAGSQSSERKIRKNSDAGSFGELDASAKWSRAVPLLRSV